MAFLLMTDPSSRTAPVPRLHPSAVSLAGDARFLTTRWDVVRAAGERSAEALESLCRDCWRPVYAFLRRQGRDRHEAQDLTQEFFARLLAGPVTRDVDPARGRFRSWLLGALKNFLANEWHKSRALKRGGGVQVFSLDEAMEEDKFHLEPAHADSPDRLFDRRWAGDLLARVNARVRSDYEAAGWGTRYNMLKVYLLGGSEPSSYAEMADLLGITEGAVKSAIYKLRQRFGQVLRAEIAQTVSSPEEEAEEIRHLLDALGS
jgi:RNA polymerase sigma factor (sigma-70 family)